MIHLKRVKNPNGSTVLISSDSVLTWFLPQGSEFIQFLQHEYLPSLQVSPEISQVGPGPEEELLLIVLVLILVFPSGAGSGPAAARRQSSEELHQGRRLPGPVLLSAWLVLSRCSGGSDSSCLQAFFQRAKL